MEKTNYDEVIARENTSEIKTSNIKKRSCKNKKQLLAKSRGKTVREKREGKDSNNSSITWLKRKDFLFTDPVNRRLEMLQIAQIKTETRVSYNSKLSCRSDIYTKSDYLNEEIVTYALNEEHSGRKPYTISEFIRLVKGFAAIRMRSWFPKPPHNNPAASKGIPEILVERDEKGQIADYGYTKSHEWSPFSERANPYHHDPLEIMLAKEEESQTNSALLEMSKGQTRTARIDFEILATTLNREDLIEGESVLPEISNQEKTIRRHHAKNKMKKITAGYCSVIKEKQEMYINNKVVELIIDHATENRSETAPSHKSEHDLDNAA